MRTGNCNTRMKNTMEGDARITNLWSNGDVLETQGASSISNTRKMLIVPCTLQSTLTFTFADGTIKNHRVYNYIAQERSVTD